jgi:SAM-dependent methyltransferase
MADWDYGYVTDIGYTQSVYRETAPGWLAMAALLMGHRPPDLKRPFRYADLGCAHGATAIAVAAACSEAEVWGFDFNPAHVETARRFAALAGLDNATFVEASFADLARRAERDLPEFDFIVAHGVLSWVSPENRRHVIDIIGRRLRPGGLAYLGYNTTSGWASMVPIRALMRMLLTAGPERSDLAVPGILDFLDRVKEAGAQYFGGHTTLDRRLELMRQQDARYIAHEYLNEDWHPLMFADVADAMAEAKCTFIGSATLTDNIEGVSVPATFVPLLAEADDVYLRETLRDIGCAQTFRRDLYRRGIAPMLPREHHVLLEELAILGLGAPIGDEITIAIPRGTVTGRPEIYRPLLAMLDNGPVSIAAAEKSEGLSGHPLTEVLQAVAMLVTGGYAAPKLPNGASPTARRTARALNSAIIEANASGDNLNWLAAPAVGAAVPTAVMEGLIVGALLEGRPSDVEALTDHVLAQLARCGRTAQKDGQPVTDPVEARRIVADAVRTTLDRRVRAFRQLGMLDG